jgi:hypothetical protein
MLFICSTANAQNTIIWDWEFEGEVGTFETAQALAGVDDRISGTYSILDFTVTSSASGATLGSVDGGQYSIGGQDTAPSFSFDWDGSFITNWNHGGTQSGQWNVFTDTADVNRQYLFGVSIDDNGVRIDDPAMAEYLDNGTSTLSAGALTIQGIPQVQSIPEPGSIAFIGCLTLGLLASRRRRLAV